MEAPSNAVLYESWTEVLVSSDKGGKEVHYYLKRRDGSTDLAVVGAEKSLRHMSYHYAMRSNRSVLYKLRSRREVIDWLDSIVSESSRKSYFSVNACSGAKDADELDIEALEHHRHHHRHCRSKNNEEDAQRCDGDIAPPPSLPVGDSKPDDDVEEGEILEEESFAESSRKKWESDAESGEIKADDFRNSNPLVGGNNHPVEEHVGNNSKTSMISGGDRADDLVTHPCVGDKSDQELALPTTCNVDPQNHIVPRIVRGDYINGDLSYGFRREEEKGQRKSGSPSKRSGKRKDYNGVDAMDLDENQSSKRRNSLSSEGSDDKYKTSSHFLSGSHHGEVYSRNISRPGELEKTSSRSQSLVEDEGLLKRKYHHERGASRDGRHGSVELGRDEARQNSPNYRRHFEDGEIHNKTSYDRERSREREIDWDKKREKDREGSRDRETEKDRRRERDRERSRDREIDGERRRERDRGRSKDQEIDGEQRRERDRERSRDREIDGEQRRERDRERSRDQQIDGEWRRERDRERSRDKEIDGERGRRRDREGSRDWEIDGEWRREKERGRGKGIDVDSEKRRGKEQDRSQEIALDGDRRREKGRDWRREIDRDGEEESEKDRGRDRDRVSGHNREREKDREIQNGRNRDKCIDIDSDRKKYKNLEDDAGERDRYKHTANSRFVEAENSQKRIRKDDLRKALNSRGDFLERNRNKLKRDADEQDDFEERISLKLAEQEEEDLNRIKEESRKRRQAILEKYKHQQSQQKNKSSAEEKEKDQGLEGNPVQTVRAPVDAPSTLDGKNDGLEGNPVQTVRAPVDAPGTLDERSSGAAVLGEGTPKSERSDDMFCDDIFGESPAGVRKSGKGDGLPIVRSGLHDNWDDAEGYYSYQFGELLDGRYEVVAAHGKGVFSTVVRAKDLKAVNGEPDKVAIKIIRNNETMHKAGQSEVQILKKLAGADPENRRHCVRFLSSFKYRNHLCLVFESLHMNLREVLKKFGRNIGLKLTAVRAYAKQLFIALKHLKNCGVLHCDIKPDNMVVNEAKNVLKLCDFGNAMFAGKNEITPYLVSRFYRAPEIILGLPYDHPLDMWSVGCCLYELYTGKVLFPGPTNNDMLRLHMELKGPFPKKMLRKGAFTDQHFDQDLNFHATEDDPVTKKTIKRIIVNIKPKDIGSIILGSPGEDPKMLANFKDILEKIFVLDPEKRMTLSQALSHPFITGK